MVQLQDRDTSQERGIDLGMPEILQTNRIKTPPAVRHLNLKLRPRISRAVRLSLLLI